MMKAMVLDTPGDVAGNPLRLDNVPMPEPGSGEVLVRVSVCGICRTDLHVVEGELECPKLPLIPGHQAVGLITRLGSGVNERTIGAPNAGNMFGACNGSNVWDQNSSAGRLCIDQPGAGYDDLVASTPTTPGCPGGPCPINVTQGCIQAWPRQVAQPSYEWGNTNNGILAMACHIDAILGLTPIIAGVDCIHGQRPGYTPYTYPHPLTTGATTSGSAPDVPIGLTVR